MNFSRGLEVKMHMEGFSHTNGRIVLDRDKFINGVGEKISLLVQSCVARIGRDYGKEQ